MKKRNIIIGSTVLVLAVLITSSFRLQETNQKNTSCKQQANEPKREKKVYQTINLAISHGHCNLPFVATVENFKVDLPPKQVDYGNFTFEGKQTMTDPLKQLKISFQLDPNTFTTEVGDSYTKKLRKEGLFKTETDQKITFTTTDVFPLGKDWYQIRGELTIKGITKRVMLRATPIYLKGNDYFSAMVVEGKVNLFDYGIDYDEATTGQSNEMPSKWMFVNLNFETC